MRRGGPDDLAPALAVWRAAEEARRGGLASPDHGVRVRAHIEDPTAFLFVVDGAYGVVGMAVGMQGLEGDGAGPP